ncbi:hypothetical protein SteCoe_11044 [Stentor coeruleus]|uniref:Phosphodiesterase n=1 Tax=Stentor coeruleus TaxID=5963 RepID=A0A1R2CE80_9CILI|nr:hypothetical protein SteCoe_11044 [Stentor coeruleus]
MIIRVGFFWGLSIVNHELDFLELSFLGSFAVAHGLLHIQQKLKFSLIKYELMNLIVGSACAVLLIFDLNGHPQMSHHQIIGSLNLTRLILIFSIQLKDCKSTLNRYSNKKFLSILSKTLNLDEVRKNEELYCQLYSILYSLKENPISSNKISISSKTVFSDNTEIVSVIKTFDYKDIPNIDSEYFDIFAFKTVACNNELVTLMTFYYYKYDFAQIMFRIQEFTNFSIQIQNGYLKNPYHNATHAADVTQFIHFMFEKCEVANVLQISVENAILLLISASIHDFKHPGYNNAFLINTEHELARTYNEESVLENFHVSSAFELIYQNDKCDFWLEVDNFTMRKHKKIIVKTVLATDFSRHFSDLQVYQNMKVQDFSKDSGQIKALEMIMHAADISNPTRPWALSKKWADLIIEENFAQGDIERELRINISPMCDRFSTNIAESQVYFSAKFVVPLFESVKNFVPKVQICTDYCDENIRNWQKLT